MNIVTIQSNDSRILQFIQSQNEEAAQVLERIKRRRKHNQNTDSLSLTQNKILNSSHKKDQTEKQENLLTDRTRDVLLNYGNPNESSRSKSPVLPSINLTPIKPRYQGIQERSGLEEYHMFGDYNLADSDRYMQFESKYLAEESRLSKYDMD